MKQLARRILALLYPPKCVLCAGLLAKKETDLCTACRLNTPAYPGSRHKLPHLAKWDALWYYEGTVRRSILRYKFYGRRSYSQSYGRLLAMKLVRENNSFDILTWIPVSRLRRWKRGYDQVELLALAAGRELGISAQRTLMKIRNNPPQTQQRNAAGRRANVLGAYCCPEPEAVRGKRILLIDDILTTGSTAGECARVLLTAGAKEVHFLALAASHNSQ